MQANLRNRAGLWHRSAALQGAGITTHGGMIETLARKRARQPRPDELANLKIEAQTLFDHLTEQYGEHTARYVYTRMKQDKSGPFKRGAKYGKK